MSKWTAVAAATQKEERTALKDMEAMAAAKGKWKEKQDR